SGDVSPSGVFWPTGTIYPVESIDLHAFAPNTAASADGWQLSDNNRDQRIITLERPSILKALLVIYTLFAVGYILFLLRVAKVDNLPTLIGLVSLFAARETLTRGVTIFPTIVDYVIFTAFVFAGIATALRLLKVQTTQG
ncbi:MAG: hypothetical protein KGJ80_11915, partial [Chloroflexota bacterium]|nr:hypothetical protein [Chloroflexota bacterium]